MGRRVWIDPFRDTTRTRVFRQNIRTEMPYSIDFTSSVADRSGVSSVSSVTWTSVGSREATIASKALATNVASATIVSTTAGYGQVRVEATYDNGDTESVYLEITFENPERR